MNGSIATAVITGLFLFSLETGASAQMGGGRTSPSTSSSTMSTESTVTCTVSSVDTASSSFVCGTNRHDSHTYQVTSSTAFSGTSLAQLAAGMSVQVQYHMSGTTAVADSVTAA